MKGLLMALTYNRLWLLLNERGVTLADLREGTRLSRATIARLRKDMPVNSTTLARICEYLDCRLDDIVSSKLDLEQSFVGRTSEQFEINSFFSGIGGFELGFESEGFSTRFQCEIDEYCQSVLGRHWPEVELHSDISALDVAQIPNADVWVGGFPCQDVSVARGKSERLGLKGARSGLFHQFSQLIEDRRPKVIVLENVAGLLSSNHGRDFGYILQRMTGLGYSVAWRVLNSRYFGIPQSRPRTYVVCWRGVGAAAGLSLFEEDKIRVPKDQRHGFIEIGTPANAYPITPRVAYCLAATSGRHTGTDWSRTYVICREGVRRMTPIEYERLQGFPDDWTLPDSVNENMDYDSLRYKAVGNAVTVPVIKWLAHRVKLALQQEVELSKIQIADLRSAIPTLRKAAQFDYDLAETDFYDARQTWKWANSGIAGAGYVWQAMTPPTPAHPIESNLGDLVLNEPQNQKYYLTPNAAEGILRRCSAQRRTLFAPLDEALRKLSAENVVNVTDYPKKAQRADFE